MLGLKSSSVVQVLVFSSTFVVGIFHCPNIVVVPDGHASAFELFDELAPWRRSHAESPKRLQDPDAHSLN